MDYVKRFFLFWYHFRIGEDWIGSLIVLAGFAATYFVARTQIAASWILITTVLISLSYSIWREVQQGSK